ncbi:hypothetical protein CDS [Bradyrhizobium sp.]|nr:hypothetical protein CDS [Bradyrhizobium sp.]
MEPLGVDAWLTSERRHIRAKPGAREGGVEADVREGVRLALFTPRRPGQAKRRSGTITTGSGLAKTWSYHRPSQLSAGSMDPGSARA